MIRAFTRKQARSFPQKAVNVFVLSLALFAQKFVLSLALFAQKFVLSLALVRAFTRTFRCKLLKAKALSDAKAFIKDLML
jgi:hypothetical protein